MTTETKKTDNHYFNNKVVLRQHFLRKYHVGTNPYVFDACSGSGILWKELRKDFPCRYWGVDQKPKKGRLEIDSSRILAQPGWDFDVIDIDTYGSPWKHWNSLLPHVKKAVTVFLTVGFVKVKGGQLDRDSLDAIGLRFRSLKPPTSLPAKLIEIVPVYCLARAPEFGLRFCEAVEAVPVGYSNARYFGVRLEQNS